MLIGLLGMLLTAPGLPTHAVLPCHRCIPVAADITDAQIFGTLSILDAAMIEAARVGVNKAYARTVREYANMLVDDHRRSKGEADTLAVRLGITPALPTDKEMAHDHTEMMEHLKYKSGAAFDREFMEGMVADHQTALVTMKDLQSKATGLELKALLLKWQPVLAKQVQTAQKWLNTHRSPARVTG